MKSPGRYKLIGKLAVPCDNLREWAIALNGANRIVAQSHIGTLFVSTVFLGLDHNWSRSGDPILFETMVFADDDPSDLYGERYSSWGEAEQGHAKAVTWAQQHMAKIAAATKIPAEEK